MTGSAEVERLFLIAASTKISAERFAADRGLDPVLVLDKSGGLMPRRVRELARKHAINRVIVHSIDWSEQITPQLYVLAAACVPDAERSIADQRVGQPVPLTSARLASLPLDALAASTAITREAVRLRRARPANGATKATGDGRAVLAIWTGESATGVGGSVTHVSGILGGFRANGLRVGLVSAGELPAQLDGVVDELEPMSPAGAGARLTTDVARIAANERVRHAAARLADRLQPSFVYQRHRPFMVAGGDVAWTLGLPLVLEWNSSEIWSRSNWNKGGRFSRSADRMLASMERRAVADADLLVAVSQHGAEMARESGADPTRTVVVPNGVNAARVTALADGITTRPAGDRPLVGWVGTFGPWHGAEVLVRAMASLPPDAGAVLIGEGAGRAESERLAVELGVADRIEWTGSLPHAETIRRLASCDVLASPHVPLDDRAFFGSPTKIFEYMAIGKPIVASRLEQIGEMLEHERSALLVTPGDPSALAAAIGELLARPDRGASLGLAARNEAVAEHDWSQRAAVVLDRLGIDRGQRD